MADGDLADPAETDPGLSQQAGDAGLCPGPVMFPMATGADADRWTQEFGYPLESQTGSISLGGLMEEVRAQDQTGRFMLEVYDEIISQKGGPGSETAAAFLTNFMPPIKGVDDRDYYFKLVFAERVEESINNAPAVTTTTTSAYWDGELIKIGSAPTDLASFEVPIYVAPIEVLSTTVFFHLRSQENAISPSRAARLVIDQVERDTVRKPYVDWLVFSGNVVFIAVGVGATVGAIRVATTVGGRLLATTALAFEVADGTEYITGFIGGKGQGYNPLKAAFRNVGQSANGASGAQMAEYIYNTLNIGVGFGGKIGLFAGSIYATTQLPSACQPVEGAITEEPLPSQGAAQRTVF